MHEAGAILYDALAAKELLEYARPGCKLGRLKGGGPNVFGRGHEELEYSRKRE